MSKPIPAINRYKADLREFTFLLFEQFGIDKLLGQAPYDAWGVDECKATLTAAYRWVREVTGPLNAIGDQQVAICNHAGNHAVRANAANDVVKVRMKQRFAAANRDDGSAQLGQLIDAAEHDFRRDGFREIVEFVAVLAGKIAPTHWNNVREQWVVGRPKRIGNHLRAADIALKRAQAAPECGLDRHVCFP